MPQAQAWAGERLPALPLPPDPSLQLCDCVRRKPLAGGNPAARALPLATEGWESRGRGSGPSPFPLFQGCHSG